MRQCTPGIRRRGAVWYIRFYDQFGRRHEERVGSSYRTAVRALASRRMEAEAARFGLRRGRKMPTLREFVEGQWRTEVAIALKPSTRRGYETALRHHLLPYFGEYPLQAITRAAVKAFIAEKSRQRRWSYATKPEHVNPDRPTLSRKTILNMVALLDSILRTAAVDYELLPANPLDGILRRKHFPTDAMRPRETRPPVLEPEDLKRAVAELGPHALRMVLVAALAGLRWGEQVALRREEEVDLRANKIRITRAFYRRVPQTPKTAQSIRDIDMCPTVRRVVQDVPWTEGLVFSPDGTRSIGDGSWIKRQWQEAQARAKINRPIRWHDLRHQFVSLLVAAGKHPLYIAQQAGHADPGFTLKRYGHLFKTIRPTPVEWWDDLLWPSGSCPHLAPITCTSRHYQAGEQASGSSPETPASKGSQG